MNFQHIIVDSPVRLQSLLSNSVEYFHISNILPLFLDGSCVSSEYICTSGCVFVGMTLLHSFEIISVTGIFSNDLVTFF